MAHITVYLPTDIEDRARREAKRQKMTLNRWIAEQITNAVKHTLPPSFLDCAGLVPDFPNLEEIRRGYRADSPRRGVDRGLTWPEYAHKDRA